MYTAELVAERNKIRQNLIALKVEKETPEFKQGYSTFNYGQGFSNENPYPPSSYESFLWKAGFNCAELKYEHDRYEIV